MRILLPLLLLAAAAAAAPRPLDKPIAKVQWRAGEQTLKGFGAFVARHAGLNVVVSAAAAKSHGDAAIVFAGKNVTTRALLDRVMEQYGLAWRLEKGILEMVTRAEYVKPAVTLRIYAIGDLGAAAKVAVGVKTVRAWSWPKVKGARVIERKGVLVITQVPAVHEAIAAHLDAERRNAAKQLPK